MRGLTILGWSFEQWELVAGQLPKRYDPTREGACSMRLDWLRCEQTPDANKRNTQYADQLFRNVRPHTVRAIRRSNYELGT